MPKPPPTAHELFKTIKPGSKVTITVHNGIGRNGPEFKWKTGRAVIVGQDVVALNMGGKHGTPGCCDIGNLVAVGKTKCSRFANVSPP